MNRVEINRCFLNAVSLNRMGSQRGKSSAEVLGKDVVQSKTYTENVDGGIGGGGGM